MTEPMNLEFSINTKVFSPRICANCTFEELYWGIKTGNFREINLAEEIQYIRSLTSHDLQQNEKRNRLPVAILNGVFSYRDKSGLLRYSSITSLDYDHLKHEELVVTKQALMNCPHVIMCFVSPSGNGLKAIVLHDNENPELHDDLYAQLLLRFDLNGSDKSTRDIARATYLSYDPDVWVNRMATPFHYTPSVPLGGPMVSNQTNNNIGQKAKIEDWSELRSIVQNQFVYHRKSDESIINMVDSCINKRIPNRTSEGYRANAIFMEATLLCEAGVKNIDKAIEKLFCVYSTLDRNEISYQFIRGYINNIEKFGKSREVWDSYGAKK